MKVLTKERKPRRRPLSLPPPVCGGFSLPGSGAMSSGGPSGAQDARREEGDGRVDGWKGSPSTTRRGGAGGRGGGGGDYNSGRG